MNLSLFPSLCRCTCATCSTHQSSPDQSENQFGAQVPGPLRWKHQIESSCAAVALTIYPEAVFVRFRTSLSVVTLTDSSAAV